MTSKSKSTPNNNTVKVATSLPTSSFIVRSNLLIFFSFSHFKHPFQKPGTTVVKNLALTKTKSTTTTATKPVLNHNTTQIEY